MWDSFLVACVLCALFVFLPGCLFFRGLGFKPSFAFAAAPLFSAAAYPILGILYDKVGIFSNWTTVFLPVLLVGVLVCIISIATSAKRKEVLALPGGASPFGRSSRRELCLYCLYAGFGILATFFVFVLNLDGADSFVQEYDNVHHLALIQTFVETGNWSCLTSSFYSGSDPSSINPIPGSAFYPAGWHCLASLVATCGGVPTAIAANAVNSVFCSTVYPLGVCALMTVLFRDDCKVIAAGAFCSFAFAAFPWKLMAWGPIFPNFAALCLFPTLATLFLLFFQSNTSRSRRAFAAAGFLVGLIAIALMQPNVAFTAVVFLVPFCAALVYHWIRKQDGAKRERRQNRTRAIVAAAAFCILAVVLWGVMFVLPPLQSLVTFSWPAYAGKAQALVNVALLSFKETPAQVLLGICVVAGIIVVINRKRNRWIIASYAVMCLMYVVCASTNGLFKQFLTGFWYADGMRLGANAAVFAIPLASVGLSSIASFVGEKVSRWPGEADVARKRAKAWSLVAALAILACIFFPNYSIPGRFDVSTAFGATCDFISRSYSASRDNVLDPEERDFLEKAAEVIPDGSVVVNEPNDGSAFGYSLYGINMYYRSMNGYGGSNETEESVIIRTDLKDASSDPEVRGALESIGAEYVLQLDQGDREASGIYLFSYDPSLWTGIDGITDATSGFEVVLSFGDMRLYKIE